MKHNEYQATTYNQDIFVLLSIVCCSCVRYVYLSTYSVRGITRAYRTITTCILDMIVLISTETCTHTHSVYVVAIRTSNGYPCPVIRFYHVHCGYPCPVVLYVRHWHWHNGYPCPVIQFYHVQSGQSGIDILTSYKQSSIWLDTLDRVASYATMQEYDDLNSMNEHYTNTKK